jgi:hypothetical protein
MEFVRPCGQNFARKPSVGFPLFGLRTTLAENLAMDAIFTIGQSSDRTACEGSSSGFGSVPNAATPPDIGIAVSAAL